MRSISLLIILVFLVPTYAFAKGDLFSIDNTAKSLKSSRPAPVTSVTTTTTTVRKQQVTQNRRKKVVTTKTATKSVQKSVDSAPPRSTPVNVPVNTMNDKYLVLNLNSNNLPPLTTEFSISKGTVIPCVLVKDVISNAKGDVVARSLDQSAGNKFRDVLFFGKVDSIVDNTFYITFESTDLKAYKVQFKGYARDSGESNNTGLKADFVDNHDVGNFLKDVGVATAEVLKAGASVINPIQGAAANSISKPIENIIEKKADPIQKLNAKHSFNIVVETAIIEEEVRVNK